MSRTAARLAVAFATLGIFVAPFAAQACATCFGDPDSGATHGLNAAILVLLGVFLAVGGAIAAAALRIRARAIASAVEAPVAATPAAAAPPSGTAGEPA